MVAAELQACMAHEFFSFRVKHPLRAMATVNVRRIVIGTVHGQRIRIEKVVKSLEAHKAKQQEIAA